MLSIAKERLVLELLSLGDLSERKVAAKAGVARGTVRSRKAGYRGHDGVENIAIADDRCPVCGATLSEIPCRACRLRRDL